MALTLGSMSIATGITINCQGSTAGSGTTNNGRAVVWHQRGVNLPPAQLLNATLYSFRIGAAVPFGGLLVSS